MTTAVLDRPKAARPPKPRCYHGWTECHFCWDATSGRPPRPPQRHRLRCACCGRWRALARTDDRCQRCDDRDFHALTLPFPP